jgi:hypothetical protein
MKNAILALGVFVLTSCSKTDKGATIITPSVVQEQNLKFTTSADTLSSSSNIIDTLPLNINITSTIPTSGVIYSIQLVRNDNSQTVYKIDTTVSQTNLAVKIPGFSAPTQYNLIITVTSKSSSSNTLSKTISLNRFYIKKFIYTDAWRNQPNLPMWFIPSGAERQVWCDLDLDGNYDAIDLSANGNQVYLKAHYYGPNYSYKKSIELSSLVRNDALNKFFKDTTSVLKDLTNANIGITDFNRDSIPDIIFGIETQEDPNSTRFINSWQIILLSKGVQDYELKVIPIFFRGGANDIYMDLNNDGICDYFSPEQLINRQVHSEWPQTRFIECYFDKNFNVSYSGKDNIPWATVSHATDFDNNGITDFVISGEDYPISGGIVASSGVGPNVYLNYSNSSIKKTVLLYSKTFSDKYQSLYYFDFSVGNMNGDINGDGKMDQVFLKSCFEGSPIITDSLKKSGIFEIFIGDGQGGFTESTSNWFDNNSNSLYLPEFANPKELLIGDVDGDGKNDIYFKFYQNLYLKNTGSKFILTRSIGSNFGFPSQSLKSQKNS